MKPFKSQAELEALKAEIVPRSSTDVEVSEMDFLTDEEREAYKRKFVVGASTDIDAIEEDSVTTRELRKLKDLELFQKWDHIENVERTNTLTKWRVVMVLRDKLKSDKLFGQFLQEQREINPTSPIWDCSSSSISRYINAARFCDVCRINDLKKVGVSISGIYALSEPVNKPLFHNLLKIVKKESSEKEKNLSLAEIEKIIYQIHSIEGEVIPKSIEKYAKHLAITGEVMQVPAQKRFEPPAQDLAGSEPVYTQADAFADTIEEIEREIEQGEVIAPVSLVAHNVAINIPYQEYEEPPEPEELEPQPGLTPEQIANKVIKYIEDCGYKGPLLVSVTDAVAKKAEIKVYGKLRKK